MPKIKFENGVVVNVEGNPTQADIDEIAQKVGVQSQPSPERTQGIFGRQGALAKGIQNIKTGVKESGEELADVLTTKGVSKPIQALKAGTTITKGIIKPFVEAGISTPARVAGEAIEGVTDYDINEAVSQGTQKLVQKGIQTETAQKVMQGWASLKEEDPELAMSLSTLLDIGDIASEATGLGVSKSVAKSTAKKGFKTAVKAGEQATRAGEKAGTFAEKISGLTKKAGVRAGEFTGATEVAPEVAKKTFKENLLQQIEGKSSSLKKLDKTKSDIIETISSDTRYHPDIDVENRTFNVTKAMQNLTQDTQNYANQLTDLFSKVDERVGGYSTKDIIDKVSENVLKKSNTSKLVTLGGEDSSFIKQTRDLLQQINKTYGEKVPRNEIWKLRQSIDKAINSMSDNQVAKSLRQDTRKAFAQALEGSLPGDEKQIVKRAMEEMQKVIEAGGYMKDTLQGFKIQGGKMTDLIRNQTATQTGALTGGLAGGLAGGPIGAAVGFVASKKVGEWLAKNTLLNASERKAIQSLVKETPEVFEDMKQYLQNLKKEKPAGLKEGLKMLNK